MTRSLTIAACIAAALIAEVYALAFHAPFHVESRGQPLEYVREFSSGGTIRQTFFSVAEGLDHIDVLMHASQPTDAVVGWDLSIVYPGGNTLRKASGRRRVHLPAGDSWQPFPIWTADPLPPSPYALTMTLERASVTAGADVMVASALNDPLPGWGLSVNGAERPGDLAFQALTKGDTLAGRFSAKVMPGFPQPFNQPWAWIGLLALLNVLAAFTVREMLVSP